MPKGKESVKTMHWQCSGIARLQNKGLQKPQLNLGLMYAKGQGVRQDYAQAVQWYHKAAEQGDAEAQFNLGLMYAKGQGVRQDDAQAVQWYRKAAEQGIAEAQFNLGLMYNQGQEFVKTMHRQCSGIVRLQNKGMQKLNLIGCDV